MGCVVGGSACFRWCCGRGREVCVFGFFSGRSFFGIDCGFLFSRRDMVSGCLSIRYGDIGWAWAFAFVDVCFLWLTFWGRCYVLCVLWSLERFVNGGGELHCSFP